MAPDEQKDGWTDGRTDGEMDMDKPISLRLRRGIMRKVMLQPYNTLKQSEYNLPFRHINKSMTLTSVINRNWGGIV